MSWSIVYEGKEDSVYLDDIVKSVRWSGDISQPSRKLSVNLANTSNGRDRLIEIEKGRGMMLLLDKKELFRGVIFADSIDSDGQMSITAYDENIYLSKNKDTRIFRNMTASAIIKKLCGEFSIPAGDIEDTGYVLPKQIFRDKTLYDMMTTALNESAKQNGLRFYLASRQGKLMLLARKKQEKIWMLENGTNLLSASYSQSIEQMRTQIKVMGGDPKKKAQSATAKDAELIRRFGLMQHLEKPEQEMTKSQLEQRAKQLLKDMGTIEDEAKIDCIGIAEVTAGVVVAVQEGMTGIEGAYYVATDEHTFEGGVHKMSLTLSASDD
ncbi:hypothetical protein ACFFSY_21955 [Paenibacillus aurantiacus]|uniref:YqbQ/XkdQ domain-containing protein n=1 Tax=Paenibacillus aurantiacus TaxID=1936118 RepID=A0ABV5KWK4_9BACL